MSDSLMTLFFTKNGRVVKDGGGILPDIVMEPDKYGMIIASLLKERLFFDYSTEYRFTHDSISNNFVFSNEDFKNFKTYLADKEYSYKTETETVLDKLKKKAEAEETVKS